MDLSGLTESEALSPVTARDAREAAGPSSSLSSSPRVPGVTGTFLWGKYLAVSEIFCLSMKPIQAF